jgi:hypothetical protein
MTDYHTDCHKDWLARLVSRGAEVVIPEIADYKVRRELLRAGKDKGIGGLDALKAMLPYAPITTPAMLKAAEFWRPPGGWGGSQQMTHLWTLT